MIRADNLRDAVYVSYSIKRKNASNEQNVGSCYIYKAIKQLMFIPPFFRFLIFWLLDSKEPGKGPTSIHRMKNPTGLVVVKIWGKFPAQWIKVSRSAGHGLTIQKRVTSIPKDYDTNKREFKLPSLAFWLAERPFRLKNRSKTRAFTAEVAPSALRLRILILETSVSSLKVSLINYLALVWLIPRPRTFWRVART